MYSSWASTTAANNGVELTGADVSVFDWSGFMLFLSWLSAPAAHPERSDSHPV
jgi:hypothetical protein